MVRNHMFSAFQAFDVVEFYAGKGNLSRMMKLSGYRTVSLDLLYGSRTSRDGMKTRKSNPFDILSPSGFATLGNIIDLFNFSWVMGVFFTISPYLLKQEYNHF